MEKDLVEENCLENSITVGKSESCSSLKSQNSLLLILSDGRRNLEEKQIKVLHTPEISSQNREIMEQFKELEEYFEGESSFSDFLKNENNSEDEDETENVKNEVIESFLVEVKQQGQLFVDGKDTKFIKENEILFSPLLGDWISSSDDGQIDFNWSYEKMVLQFTKQFREKVEHLWKIEWCFDYFGQKIIIRKVPYNSGYYLLNFNKAHFLSKVTSNFWGVNNFSRLLTSQGENILYNYQMYQRTLNTFSNVVLKQFDIMDFIWNKWLDDCWKNSQKSYLIDWTQFLIKLDTSGILESELKVKTFYKDIFKKCLEQMKISSKDGFNGEKFDNEPIFYKYPDAISTFTCFLYYAIPYCPSYPNYIVDYHKFFNIYKQKTLTEREAEGRAKFTFLKWFFNAFIESFEENITNYLYLGFPYYRILTGIFEEIFPEQFIEVDFRKREILAEISGLIYKLRPSKYPSFFYYWTLFLCNKKFISYMLFPCPTNTQVTPDYRSMIFELLDYIKPIMENGIHILSKPSLTICKMITSLFVYIVQNNPIWLYHNSLNFVDRLPYHLVQLRNLILSSFSVRIFTQKQTNDNDEEKVKVDIFPLYDTSMEVCLTASYIDLNSLVFLGNEELPGLLKNMLECFYADPSILRLFNISEYWIKRRTQFGNNFQWNNRNLRQVTYYTTSRHMSQLKSQGILAFANIDYNIGGFMNVFYFFLRILDINGRHAFINLLLDRMNKPGFITQYYLFLCIHLFETTNNEDFRRHFLSFMCLRYKEPGPVPWGIQFALKEFERRYNFRVSSFIEGDPTYKILHNLSEKFVIQEFSVPPLLNKVGLIRKPLFD